MLRYGGPREVYESHRIASQARRLRTRVVHVTCHQLSSTVINCHHIFMYVHYIYSLIYCIYIYIYIITTLFVGCKHGGRSKNASNNFDPFVFFPDGEGYMYVRPPHVKNRASEDLHLEGGSKVRNRYVTPYPPPVPAPYSTDRGEVKMLLGHLYHG